MPACASSQSCMLHSPLPAMAGDPHVTMKAPSNDHVSSPTVTLPPVGGTPRWPSMSAAMPMRPSRLMTPLSRMSARSGQLSSASPMPVSWSTSPGVRVQSPGSGKNSQPSYEIWVTDGVAPSKRMRPSLPTSAYPSSCDSLVRLNVPSRSPLTPACHRRPDTGDRRWDARRRCRVRRSGIAPDETAGAGATIMAKARVMTTTPAKAMPRSVKERSSLGTDQAVAGAGSSCAGVRSGTMNRPRNQGAHRDHDERGHARDQRAI